MPKAIRSKLDLSRPSFEETEVGDYDDDFSESELENEQPEANSKCLVILCGILMLPFIFGVAYFLLYVYVPETRTASYLSGVPSGIYQSGPLVGHTTHSSSKIWFYQGGYKPMEIVYWYYTSNMTDSFYHIDGEIESFTSQLEAVDLIPDLEANGAATSTIQGLQANTTYHYEIQLDNATIAKGKFKTAPLLSIGVSLPRNRVLFLSNDTSLPSNDTSFPSNGTSIQSNDTSLPSSKGISFKYLLASCMNVKSYTQGYKSQPVWDEVMKKNVDFALLPGDTVYTNYKDRSAQGEIKYNRLWFRNLQQRAESHFANFISKTPIYSSWDDHDYGSNDGDHSQLGKENSLAAWGHLWPNPYQGSSKGTGNYYSYSWGDVDYYVMDCRWYRNHNNGTLFGKPQMEWLTEKLIESNATFKIIVSGSDVMERGLTGDLKDIGKLVKKHSISGVLFNSGDIHRNQFKSQGVSNWPYRVVQITSSGIARVKERPFAIISIDTSLEDPEILTQFYIADSKNQRETTWSNNATVDCHEIRNSKDRDMKQRCSSVVRLSDLTPS